jgi:hypothetical protein
MGDVASQTNKRCIEPGKKQRKENSGRVDSKFFKRVCKLVLIADCF